MTANTPPEAVVLVHGLWMNGWEMSVLRWRLGRAGYRVHRFHYPSTTATVPQNAARLARFAEALDAPAVHFVCHSLGGLVALRFFQDFPDQPPGRVVLLGTPVAGSAAARRAAGQGLWRWLMGASLGEDGLPGNELVWRQDRALGMIAGTVPLGLAWLVGGLRETNDGTVGLSETRQPWIPQHRTFRVSHMGMLVSRKVARAVSGFLGTGRFP